MHLNKRIHVGHYEEVFFIKPAVSIMYFVIQMCYSINYIYITIMNISKPDRKEPMGKMESKVLTML